MHFIAFHLTAGNRSYMYCIKDISYWIKRKGKKIHQKNKKILVEKLKRYLDLT